MWSKMEHTNPTDEILKNFIWKNFKLTEIWQRESSARNTLNTLSTNSAFVNILPYLLYYLHLLCVYLVYMCIYAYTYTHMIFSESFESKLVPTHVVPNTNRSLEGDGTILLVFVCSPGEDGGILGIFLSI